jgi:hypothetical protein
LRRLGQGEESGREEHVGKFYRQTPDRGSLCWD